MIFNLTIGNNDYTIDTEIAHSIAIPLKFNKQQPNHFGAEIATKKAIQGGGFIGDTKRGGSCNVDSITLVPHCNGTHTESVAHILNQKESIGSNLSASLASCRLISIKPIISSKTNDTYLPELEKTDRVIDLKNLQKQLSEKQLKQIDALVIRTLPNDKDKLSHTYGVDNQPPFFTHQAISWLSSANIKHLLVDMPSIDKMYDSGQLSNHHIYWHVKQNSRLINDKSIVKRTITEMIFVNNSITDGLYCLNLQLPAFELDAAPSRPILYPLTPKLSK